MPDPAPLIPLKAALSDLVDLLRSEKVPGVVIGGVATSLLGRPRMTRDIDLVVWLPEKRWDSFLKASGARGLEGRIRDALAFARRSKVLLLRHRPTGIDVDVSMGSLSYMKEVIDRGVWRALGDLSLPLPRSEDLVVLKAVAHRPRDTADIEAILEAQPDLDREHARRWVGEFARALQAPEILSDLEAIFSRLPARR